MPYIDCKQIVKAYTVADHEIVALRGIDFAMERGEMVAIIGPSGAGKSSLLNLLGGLDQPTAGQLSVGGENLLTLKGRALADYRLKRVGFVWQQVDRNLFGDRHALANVALPMALAGMGRHARRARAHDLLAAVGLADHAHSQPAQLSGGQQQRVAIAVALANQPDLLLLDEPTGALDRTTAAQVVELIDHLRREFELSVLMVTHDLEIAAAADRVLTLRDGALGQDLTAHAEDDALKFDEGGRIRLPDAVRTHFHDAHHIAVEIRPEGVLLRPENAYEDDFAADSEQDAAPRGHTGRLARFLRRAPRHTDQEHGKAAS